eukprot:4903582-Pyramimonas_sp.AAC.2
MEATIIRACNLVCKPVGRSAYLERPYLRARSRAEAFPRPVRQLTWLRDGVPQRDGDGGDGADHLLAAGGVGRANGGAAAHPRCA